MPSRLTASARGCWPRIGTRTGDAAVFAGSMTISVRACAHDTQARRGEPANTTSAGSSSVAIVFTTVPRSRSTTLIVSDRWLTTQASVFEATRTETGSMPTLTTVERDTRSAATSKISRVPAAVFTASRRLPSGVSSSGWTWGASKLAKLGVDVPAVSAALVASAGPCGGAPVSLSRLAGIPSQPVPDAASGAVADGVAGADEAGAPGSPQAPSTSNAAMAAASRGVRAGAVRWGRRGAVIEASGSRRRMCAPVAAQPRGRGRAGP